MGASRKRWLKPPSVVGSAQLLGVRFSSASIGCARRKAALVMQGGKACGRSREASSGTRSAAEEEVAAAAAAAAAGKTGAGGGQAHHNGRGGLKRKAARVAALVPMALRWKGRRAAPAAPAPPSRLASTA